MTNLVPAEDLDRIHTQYERLEFFIKHIAEGQLRALIVSGPPGVGKSYMVKQHLRKYESEPHRSLHGKITPLSLFDALYKQREQKQVLVLDDTDSIFKDPDGQNLLKAAMDTTLVRQVDWASSTTLLKAMSLPESFKFAGSVVLITNVGFDSNKKMSVHLKAIKDRSFPLVIGSDDQKTKFAMVVYMVERQDMLRAFNFSANEKAMLLEYVHASLDKIQHLSLRQIMKLAELYRLEPTNWRYLADGALVEL